MIMSFSVEFKLDGHCSTAIEFQSIIGQKIVTHTYFSPTKAPDKTVKTKNLLGGMLTK